MEEKILDVRGLTVCFQTAKGTIRPVDDVSLTVPRGSIVGIVGESGCGKSMTARAVMGLVRYPGKVTGGSVLLDGREISALPERERRKLRGSEISMIFQEPMTSLNPVMRVGRQVEEAVLLHTDCTREEAKARVLEIFREVEIPEPEARYDCYPHQLSGGLRQRVLIAMAVISHNLGVIARVCDYVFVMYAGRIVEQAGTEALFERPRHPYTRGLFRAIASLREGGDALETIPGVVPNLLHLPAGCSFSLRCASCRSDCERRLPALTETEPGHKVRCFLAGEGGAR